VALQKLQYSKDWRRSQDFPTYEGNEAKVREDLQLLFTEAQTALNNLIDALGAGEIPFSATSAIDAENVQAAIEVVQAQIASILDDPDSVTLPDDSIVTSKYKNGSVTLAKLNEDVTPAGLGAAAAVHTHDDRYYTEEELTNLSGTGLLDQKQPKTSTLPTLANDPADANTFPIYDQSVAASRQITFAKLKNVLKAHIDTFYAVHASRHAPNGADPLTVTVGNLGDEAVETAKIKDLNVTRDKLENNAVSNLYAATITTDWTALGTPFVQEHTVTGMIEDEEPTMAVSSSATEEQQAAYTAAEISVSGVEDDKIKLSAVNKPLIAIPVRFTVQRTYEVTLGTTWTSGDNDVVQTVSCTGVRPSPSSVSYSKVSGTDANYNKLATANTVFGTDEITFHASSATGAAVVVKVEATYYYDVTLTITEPVWAATGAPFTQDIEVEGLTIDDHPIVDVVPSDTYSTARDQMDAWAEVYKFVASATDTLTVYANSDPETAIPIQILCIRK
jgi:hypothetical protein